MLIVKKPNEQPKIVEVEEIDLKTLQNLVEGNIQLVRVEISECNYDLYVHEEGKLIGLDSNFFLVDSYNNLDCVAGNAIFAKTDKTGNILKLNKSDCDRIMNHFKISNLVSFQ